MIPLLHLVKQLLRNISSQTSMMLTEQSLPTGVTAAPGSTSPGEVDLTSDSEDSFLASEEPTTARPSEMLPNLNLLLRFQRLLFCQLYPPENREDRCDYERDLPGALSLLKKYVQMLSHHVVEVLPQGGNSIEKIVV